MSFLSVSFRSEILHFKQPAGTSRGVYHERRVWYVEVRGEQTTGGLSRSLYGIGECAPLPDLSCDDPARYEEVLAQACRHLQQTGEIPFEMLQSFPSILMGLETALRSYHACLVGGSPFRLYDSPFTRGEHSIVINGLIWMGNSKEMAARVEEKVAAGFSCIKLKIGAIDYAQERRLIEHLRSRFSPAQLQIRLDANGAFSPQLAEERLADLAPFSIHSIEQPIAPGGWEAMADLCRHSPIPIALDEELIGHNNTAARTRLLDALRPQYLVLKPSLHGGFSGAEEWMALADERGIGHWCTSALESNVGLNAIAQWCSTRYTADAALPQGLGTGQIFVDNYPHIALSLEGQRLWAADATERAFQAQVRAFTDEWKQPSPTMKVKTSGSTGRPKTLEVKKRDMAASAHRTLEALQLAPHHIALLCLPLDYVAGKMMTVRALVGNLPLIAVAPSSHPLRHQQVAPSFIAVTPMQALTTLQTPGERECFCRIPRILIGGGAVSQQLLAAVQACEGEVYSTYGMTETLSHIALRRLNGPSAADAYTPLPDVRLSVDESGRLLIHDPLTTPRPLLTNDRAELRPDGTFRILGRVDNMVCSGGLKLQLEELEERLAELPCPFLLTAVPDPLLGEALTLLHEPTTTPLSQLCVELLNKYEQPRHYLCIPHLPLTATGKPARAEAARLACTLLKGNAL